MMGEKERKKNENPSRWLFFLLLVPIQGSKDGNTYQLNAVNINKNKISYVRV